MSSAGFEFTLRSYGVRNAMRNLELSMRETQAVLTTALVTQAEALKAALEEATPVAQYDPGQQHGPHAQERYSVVVVGPNQVEVRNPTPQAHILLTGSVEHDITPKNAAYLVFRSREGGLARMLAVHHPGTTRNAAMVAVIRRFSFESRLAGRALGGKITALWGRGVLVEDL